MMETSWKIAVKDIEKIEKKGSEIYLQNRKVDTTLISSRDKGEFREFVEYVVFSLRNVSGSTKQSAIEPAAKPSTNKLMDREYLNLASSHVNSIEKPNIKKYVFSVADGKNIVDKFDKAIAAYGKLKEWEMPLVLFDNTAFGSAKDGFLVTDTTVYAHNMWQAPIQIPIESIMSIKVVGSDLIINGQKIYINMIDSSDRRYFEDFCTRLLLTLREHII
jgi:hypothetical protein